MPIGVADLICHIFFVLVIIGYSKKSQDTHRDLNPGVSFEKGCMKMQPFSLSAYLNTFAWPLPSITVSTFSHAPLHIATASQIAGRGARVHMSERPLHHTVFHIFAESCPIVQYEQIKGSTMRHTARKGPGRCSWLRTQRLFSAWPRYF